MYRKSQVGFEHPAKGPDHCSECRHFRPPDSCEIVSGEIRPEDWCRKFMPAKSKAQQEAMAIAEHEPGKLYSRNKGLLSMTHGQLHDFAATPRKNLPKYAGKKKRFSI